MNVTRNSITPLSATLKSKTGLMLLLFFLILPWSSCNRVAPEDAERAEDANEIPKENILDWKSILVTATAYNSLPNQGQGNVNITSTGDTLQPGEQSIAVSRDLLKKGLSLGTKVKISGLDGFFIVNDKMHSRWKNKIDIYMGENRNRALQWGRRKVEICFPTNNNQNQ